MSRLIYSRPDSIDEDIIKWLYLEINIKELKTKKAPLRILVEDVIPNFKDLVSHLSPENVTHLINCEILDKKTHNMLPLGKGYLYSIILQII